MIVILVRCPRQMPSLMETHAKARQNICQLSGFVLVSYTNKKHNQI